MATRAIDICMRAGPARWISAVLLACAGSPVSAEGTNELVLERVEITGSRLSIVGAETALPVLVIGREQIERSGARSVEEMLTFLSTSTHTDKQATTAGFSASPGYSGVSMRGFGGAGTLILLDGRRLANFAFAGGGSPGVDLNAIPLTAIERVEILKDGASAIYGSDALGGVINFILRKNVRGGEVSAGGGFAKQGGAGTFSGSALVGGGDLAVDGYNAFVLLDARRQDPLFARDRSFAAGGYRPEEGIDLTSPNAFPANINAGGTLLNPANPPCAPEMLPRTRSCRSDVVPWSSIVPGTESTSVLARGVLTVAGSSELYGEVFWSRHRFDSSVTPPAINPTTLGVGPLLLPPGSTFYPAGLGLSGPLDLRYRTVPLGARVNRVVTDQGRALVGWRGELGGWDIDTGVAHAEARATNRYRSGYVDAQKLVDAFATGLVNPFGDSGAAGDALLAGAELRGVTRRGASTTDSIDVRARRDMAQWRHGTVSLSLGAEARRERISDEATPVVGQSTGAPVSVDYDQSTAGSRRSQAIFAELGVPIAPQVEAQLALRTDHFSDFGTTTTPKAALRWQAASWLVFRGSVGRGFRAPSLAELYTAQQSVVAPTGLPDPLRCPLTGAPADCSLETTIVFGGNPDLQPMRTRQQTLGFVVEPARGASFGLEFWKVRTTGYIARQTVGEALSGVPAYEGTVVIRGPADPATPGLPGPIVRLLAGNQNIGTFEASGIDVDARWRGEIDAVGKVTLAMNGEYNTKVAGQFDGLTYSSILGTSSVGGLVVPRWEHRATVSIERGAWVTTLGNRLRTGYVDVPSESLPERRVGADIVWNARLAYTGWRTAAGDIIAAVGVNNVFDRDPPFTRLTNGVFVGYDPSNGDPIGRFFYATLRWRFR